MQTSFWGPLSQRFLKTYFACAEPLASKTTLRVGGFCDYYAEPEDLEALTAVLEHTWARGVPVFALGRGSNLLVRDDGFRGCVIRLKGVFWQTCLFLSPLEVFVGAGLRLKEFCGHLCKGGWGGLEFLEGIPGCVGGALFMNAGAQGGWMHDAVLGVQGVTHDGQVRVLKVAELGAGYRHCKGLEGLIVTHAWLKRPLEADSQAVFEKMALLAQKRKASQPQDPSAGCVFKNPGEGHPPAGQLIDQAGLKGLSVGGAEVSRKHANFIVTAQGARAQDVLDLIARVQDRVFQAHRVALEPELRIL